MSLAKHIYEELEAIVGPQHISDKPYIMAGAHYPGPQSPMMPKRPAAILLPASTEEVASIVKVCNKHGLRYIPTVSSMIAFAYPSADKTVIMHLKRMNKVHEINVEDRYAVIEPGVRHGQFRTELMKYGLSYPVASVGPGGSVLSSFAAMSGDNHCEHGASRTNRYVNGVEWVTPSGEIVRVGSLATESGWFCADGPGPSLRGLIKGFIGQAGGLGVITRIAAGLDGWKGPKQMPTTGRSPRYKTRLDPKCHKFFIFKFPDLDTLRDAMIEVGKAEIGHGVMKYFNASAALLATESANEFWDLWNSGLFQRELARPLYVFLSAWSEEELAYEEGVLMDIVAETGGEPVEQEILSKYYEDNMDFFILVGFLQRVLRLGGGWAPCKLSGDSIAHMFDIAKTIPEFMTEFIEKGLVFNAPDNFLIDPMEFGRGAHIELLFLWDRTLPNWRSIPMDFMRRSLETEIKHGHHGTMPPRYSAGRNSLGPLYSNAHIWSEAIKRAFDPKSLSNPQP